MSAVATRTLLPGSYLRDDTTLLCVVNMLTDVAVEDDGGHQVLVNRPDHDAFLLEDCSEGGTIRWYDEEKVADMIYVRGPQ